MASKQKIEPFPFSSLPDKEQKAVVKQMDCFSQFTLSICDEVTSNLVKTCGLKCWNMVVNFEETCYIEVELIDYTNAIITFIRDPNRDYTKVQHEHVCVVMRDCFNDELRYECRKPEFTLRDWIKHVMAVFNRDDIDVYYEKDTYCLDFIRDTFNGIKLNEIVFSNETDPDFRGYSILKSFPPPNILYPSSLSEQEFSKVLIQNFDILRPREFKKIKLDYLLLNNSHYLESIHFAVTPKILNRFIKLWRDGSNQRLRYLKLKYLTSESDPLDTILDGVDYQEQQQEKVFNRDHDDHHETQVIKKVVGGYDIQSNDGKLATVKISYLYPVFQMFIWI